MTDNESMQYSVCITTFKRPESLKRLILSIVDQTWLPPQSSWEIIIIDNDSSESAHNIVDQFKKNYPHKIEYHSEKTPNISLARNRGILESNYDNIIFIDDDQSLDKEWFLTLNSIWESVDPTISAAITAVPPLFDQEIPEWLANARAFQRITPADLSPVLFSGMRTGGSIIRRHCFSGSNENFEEKFGKTGGEDTAFFKKLNESGCKFIGINSVKTFEHFSADRCSLNWVLKRNFRGGSTWVMTSKRNKVLTFIKALSKATVLTLMLPFTIILGSKYAIKILERLFSQSGQMSACIRKSYDYY
jgi:succinoglycan biosynthesis protein ExoM